MFPVYEPLESFSPIFTLSSSIERRFPLTLSFADDAFILDTLSSSSNVSSTSNSSSSSTLSSSFDTDDDFPSIVTLQLFASLCVTLSPSESLIFISLLEIETNVPSSSSVSEELSFVSIFTFSALSAPFKVI